MKELIASIKLRLSLAMEAVDGGEPERAIRLLRRVEDYVADLDAHLNAPIMPRAHTPPCMICGGDHPAIECHLRGQQ